jgi:DNA-binding response OmpR family regulator
MRILLVEDHQDIAANISEYFGARGDVVDHAADGIRGYQMATSQPYDVIVLDLMLPGIDGLTVCRRLRGDAHLRTPILMLTAKDLLANKVDGFEAGADDYLVKPFSLVELSARLMALTRRAARLAESSVLTVGDLRFDLNTLMADRGGEPVKLNPTTRRLLTVLMRNAHRVVTKTELEHEIWGNTPPEGDVLRAHMHALRAAIDKGFGRKLLLTVHGTGYRLAVDDETAA